MLFRSQDAPLAWQQLSTVDEISQALCDASLPLLQAYHSLVAEKMDALGERHQTFRSAHINLWYDELKVRLEHHQEHPLLIPPTAHQVEVSELKHSLQVWQEQDSREEKQNSREKQSSREPEHKNAQLWQLQLEMLDIIQASSELKQRLKAVMVVLNPLLLRMAELVAKYSTVHSGSLLEGQKVSPKVFLYLQNLALSEATAQIGRAHV